MSEERYLNIFANKHKILRFFLLRISTDKRADSQFRKDLMIASQGQYTQFFIQESSAMEKKNYSSSI